MQAVKVLGALLIVCLCSCGHKGEGIIGKWKMVASGNGSSVRGDMEREFRSDHTFTLTVKENGQLMLRDTGTYSLQGKSLEMTVDKGVVGNGQGATIPDPNIAGFKQQYDWSITNNALTLVGLRGTVVETWQRNN